MDQERYELVDVIGSGGMATVWRAQDTRLGRVVAIKRPHPAPADSTTLPRFAREARAAATVNHPNLVSVYDVGEDAAGPYLVMEFVDGPSLATTTVPRARIATFGVQVASALGALHAAGIVHGDVKPANILVAGDSVKLTDFGIARTGTDTTALTREGVIFATPEYAAPETLATGDRTAAADVYALAAVLHELVTGRRWTAATATTGAATEVMPPADWLPALSGALAQDPDRRPSAEAFGAELARLQGSAAPLPAPVLTVPSAPASAPTPTPAPVPTLVSPASAAHQDNGRRATIIFVAAVLALAVVGGIIALTNDGATTMTPAADTSVATSLVNVAPALPPETAPLPTEPPATDAPTTVVEATAAPQTSAPVDTAATATALGQDLADLIGREVSNGLDEDVAIDIVDSLNEAIVAAEAGEDNRVERALRDARRRIDRFDDDESRDGAIALLAALGVELGVDPDRIDRPPPGDGDDDDD